MNITRTWLNNNKLFKEANIFKHKLWGYIMIFLKLIQGKILRKRLNQRKKTRMLAILYP